MYTPIGKRLGIGCLVKDGREESIHDESDDSFEQIGEGSFGEIRYAETDSPANIVKITSCVFSRMVLSHCVALVVSYVALWAWQLVSTYSHYCGYCGSYFC